ncbi:MAG: pirin family protein [Bacteroidetes bacterium]|nr:pirin family protein [Bacteroidota bacterium]
MKTIFHAASSRGHADHGWLNAHHSFSFASWYDPSRVHFGMLRVLNDDIVAGGQGFGTHPHNDMEIITIILKGALEHKDNMGNGSVIRPGDVQVMSAGTGVMHSEFNPSKDEATNLFQLWIFPKEKGIKPGYDQRTFDVADRKNKIQTVVSGFKTGDELYIHQDAAISLSDLDKGTELKYAMKSKENGAYIMVINGAVEIEGQKLQQRDAIGVWENENVSIKASENAEIIIIEVPMN